MLEQVKLTETDRWLFTITDRFGGQHVLFFDKAKIIARLLETFNSAPGPAEEDIAAEAQARCLTLNQIKELIQKSHELLVAKYTEHAEKLLAKELVPAFEEMLVSLIDQVWAQTVFDFYGNLQERALVIPTESRKIVTDRLLSLRDQAAKKRLNVQGRGRPAKWSKEKLEAATLKANAYIKKRKTPNLDEIAKVLNKRYQNNEPLTGNSLRQLLKRYGIDWKTIKRS